MRRITLVVWASIFLLAGTALLQGQGVTTGTIQGTVTDPTGAVVPGAEVQLLNENTGLARRVTTRASGTYIFPALPVGTYTVTVVQSGFKTARRTGIELDVVETVVLNIALEVGAVGEEVVVEASPVAVETESGEVSGLIRGTQIRESPMNGRNFVQLTTLMPGVAPAENFDPKNKGLFAAIDMSVSGAGSNANLWTVDAVNNNDVGSNRTPLILPSIDQIEEFKIHRNSYGAEFGQAGGAHINIVTRSGGNDFHGTVYYFGRNDKLNATHYFLNLADQPKSVLRRNDFGYTIGGPIVRDRAFFFWSQEWNREKRGVVSTALVPTAAEKQGDFGSIFIPSLGTNVTSSCQLDASGALATNFIPLDPLSPNPGPDGVFGTADDTFNPFPGNQIPADRLSPAGLLFLQLYPDANILPTDANPCPNPNWVSSTTVPVNWREESIRGDVNLTESTSLMVRYTQDSWENTKTGGDANGLWGDDPFPAVDASWDQPSKSLAVKLTQTIGTTMVNDFQFSYSANEIVITRGTGGGLVDSINATMPPIFPLSEKVSGEQRTHPTFWGGQGYPALWHLAPWDNNQDLFSWKDDFSAVVGSHTFKAGFLFTHNKKNEIIAQPEEVSQFWGAAGINGWGATSGNVLADFLLVDMTHGFVESQHARDIKQRWRDIEFYVGDTWRVTPNLTLDYGIRWSFLRHPYLADDQIASFVPALFDPALGNDPCNGLVLPPGTNFCQAAGFLGGTGGPNRALVRNDNDTIAPRFGVAWDPTGKGEMAIRAGFGQFFQREMLSPNLNTAGFNPPFNSTREGIRFLDSAGDCCGFAGGFGAPAWGLESDALIPNNWQWNLTIERQLWQDTVFEIGYVGNRGLHLLKRMDVNQVLPGDRDGNGVDDRIDFVQANGDPARQASLRPFGVFGVDAAIQVNSRSADSIYHSLQTMFRTRFGRNSLVQLSYTWSKNISTDPNNGATFNVFDAYADNTNLELDRGESELNRPHIFTANMVYNLPALETYASPIRHVFGNWELSSIVTFSSGNSLTIFQGNPGGVNGFSGTGIADYQRPHRVPDEPCRAKGGPPHQWLNPEAFTFDGFQFGQIGTAGRGICSRPGLNNWDIAFLKNFDIPLKSGSYFGENLRIQFRFEFFNAFNHPQFRLPGNPIGLGANNVCYNNTPDGCTANLGDITGATAVVTSRPDPNFGTATRTRGPREIQYAIKIIF